ncbi:MAG TPA: 2OG-Fe(II) oxygenase [Propionicimonas sp.]|nr:2OG-Fe(II) oxygenase [Propionicimonas sp.]
MPGTEDEFWRGYLHVNETKYSNTVPESWGSTLNAVAREFCSPRFVEFLTELTGIENLMPDWSMDGGGLHQTLRGGHLNIHADFTTHHDHPDWARRVNILLYLNREWPTEWGGQLELWDKEMTSCQGKVTPAGNRMLVFTTSFDSFHGHPDGLTCPPGEARRSMALYYFTQDENAVRRATNYRARPDDGLRKWAIGADRVALDLYDRAKRRMNIDEAKVSAVLARIDRLRRRKRRS